MPKVIKIVVSDKFFEEHIEGDPKTLATQNVDFAEGMTRMILGKYFKDTEDIELNTDEVKDEKLTKLVQHSIVNCLTVKLAMEHGKENQEGS